MNLGGHMCYVKNALPFSFNFETLKAMHGFLPIILSLPLSSYSGHYSLATRFCHSYRTSVGLSYKGSSKVTFKFFG